MLSLYIHIPFCKKKCSYCDFFIAPVDKIDEKKTFIWKYNKSLLNQIDYYSKIFANEKIKTIYFGWWTPLLLGKENIFNIINNLLENFDLSNCEEINFELNPDPFDEVLDFIDSFNKTYFNFFRIRYSFGIQSLNDEVLKYTNRNYYYNTLISFIRTLTDYKQVNNVFNFDFIAFGAIDDFWNWLPDYKKKFLSDFIFSGFADSFSIYTLELFPGSVMYSNYTSNNEKVYQEFDNFKKILMNSWYKRYEISNFEISWKRSLHNMIYWNMWQYLWLGMWASSFLYRDYADQIFKKLNTEIKAVRFENTKNWKFFFENKFYDYKNIFEMKKNDLLVDKFFMWLRTKEGLQNFEKFDDVLVENWQDIKKELEINNFMKTKDWRTFLKSKWMDVYNDIISKFLKYI